MRNLKLIIVFIVVFFSGQFLISNLFGYLLLKSEFRYSQIYSKNKVLDYEILCLGNSRGVNSFYSPYLKSHGINAYNISFNGIGPLAMKYIIKDYIMTNRKPKTIFIEVSSAFNFNIKENLNQFNLFMPYSIGFDSAIAKTDPMDHNLMKIFPLLKFNNELFYRALYYMNRNDQEWVNEYKINDRLIEDTKLIQEFDLNLNYNDIKIFKELEEDLRNEGIKVYFFIAPYYPIYKRKMANIDKIINILNFEFFEDVIDLSGFLIEDDYFADRIHTNKKGAILITKKLMKLNSDIDKLILN